MNSSDNLLVHLSKWASGQQENFLSDAFVHLLNLFAQHRPDDFAAIVGQITVGTITPTPETAAGFTIVSQISTDEGIPDITIRGPDAYALIEVKDESPVNNEQIERYLRLVEQDSAATKCLVLLTRHQAPPLGSSNLLTTIRWTQVSEWLTALDKFNLDPVSRYTLEQFLGFLEAKGMSVNKAGWEMVSGIQQFSNFKVLLKQAMESAGAHKVYSAYGADFNGWAIPDAAGNKSVFYVFISFEEPGVLRFLCASSEVRDEFKNAWKVTKGDSKSFERSLELGSEEVHFFSRGLDSQTTVLAEFVSSCLAQTTSGGMSPPVAQVSAS